MPSNSGQKLTLLTLGYRIGSMANPILDAALAAISITSHAWSKDQECQTRPILWIPQDAKLLEGRWDFYRNLFLGNQLYLNYGYDDSDDYPADGMNVNDTAIISVNRMISEEAACIMYRDTYVFVRAADI